MKKYVLLLLTVAAAMFAIVQWDFQKHRDPHDIANPDPNHTHTDFAVWIDGDRMDFSAPELMSEKEDDDSATADHAKHGHQHHDYLHLHDGVGHVIHRHKPGLSIGEFFESIRISISGTCYASFTPLADGELCGSTPFRLFVNGSEMPFTMDYVFEDLDQILITNAANDAEVARELSVMTDDACVYSERCPWRGEVPVENCIADPAIPCTE
jgi:hypothetical protein